MRMKKNISVITCFVALLMLLLPGTIIAEDVKTIQLPAPRMEGGMPLMEALKLRHSGRSYADKMLSGQTLSNLLWAAFGINRPDSGKRTAPSAMNWQELDIYVATAEGVYRYDAKNNLLVRVAAKDLREKTGIQPFVKTAPVNLVYVSDYARMKGNEDGKKLMSWSHAGFVSQNVYLFCTSEGLATVVRAGGDREAMAKELGLTPDQHITLFQSLGYPEGQ